MNISILGKNLFWRKNIFRYSPWNYPFIIKPDCKQGVIDELTKSISILRKKPYLKCIKTAFNFDLSENLVDFNVPTQLIFSTHEN